MLKLLAYVSLIIVIYSFLTNKLPMNIINEWIAYFSQDSFSLNGAGEDIKKYIINLFGSNVEELKKSFN
jgi:hypothetical protein